MTKHAAGTFDIGVFEAEKPYDEHLGTAIARVHVEQTFSGDLVGAGTAELITVTTGDTPRAYVAIESSSARTAATPTHSTTNSAETRTTVPALAS